MDAARAALQQRETELAEARRRVEEAGVQLASTQERCGRLEAEAAAAKEGHLQASQRARAAEAQLRVLVGEREEAVQVGRLGIAL